MPQSSDNTSPTSGAPVPSRAQKPDAKGALPHAHKGWHSRGYLPHFDDARQIQSVTFRLADSLPSDKQHLLDDIKEKQRVRQIETLLDKGYGSCVLRDPACAQAVIDTLSARDDEDYRLLAWVIMPNHVHCLFEQREGVALGGIVKAWKRVSVSKINEIKNRSGKLWAKDYFDRYIRDVDHLSNTISYIHSNPVKAGLCTKPEDWLRSSARSQPRWTTKTPSGPDGVF